MQRMQMPLLPLTFLNCWKLLHLCPYQRLGSYAMLHRLFTAKALIEKYWLQIGLWSGLSQWSWPESFGPPLIFWGTTGRRLTCGQGPYPGPRCTIAPTFRVKDRDDFGLLTRRLVRGAGVPTRSHTLHLLITLAQMLLISWIHICAMMTLVSWTRSWTRWDSVACCYVYMCKVMGMRKQTL